MVYTGVWSLEGMFSGMYTDLESSINNPVATVT